jgi:hypothetical protein
MAALRWIGIGLAAWLVYRVWIGAAAWPPDARTAAASAMLALVVVLLLYRRKQVALLSVLGRGVAILLPISLAFLVPILLVLSLPALDVRLKQATIAALIIAAGWVTTFVFQQEREQKLRDDRRQDTLSALQQEIFNVLSKLDSQDIRASAQTQQNRIRNGGFGPYGYVPFSTSESPPIVFDAVSDSIPLLKSETIEPVLRFYAEYADLRTLIQDMKTDEYRGLAPDRRIAVHDALKDRRIVTLKWAMNALVAVNEALGLSKEDARALDRSGLNPTITPEAGS